MGCILLLLEYYGLSGSGGGGVTMTTGLLRGLGLPVERGRSVSACSEHGACGSVRAGARVVVEGWGVGTGLSIMVCPLRGNYAESCVSVGGGGDYYGMSAPFVCL